ncbi:MAG TPA: ATP-binding protein [Stellaceae bacterium]|nr:ATP-binding protein [Stellaceae bacterium]
MLSENPEGGIEDEALAARQIRLYIENAPVFFPLVVVVGVALVAAGLWEFLPADHSVLLSWAASIVATSIARLLAWAAYAGAKPDDDAIRTWLKWFLLPQICTLSLMGAGPIFLLPTSSGHDVEVALILSLWVYVAAPTGSMKLSGYRPAIALALAPMLLMYLVGLAPLPGVMPKVLMLGGVAAVFTAYSLAIRINRDFVRTMQLTMRNERLVAALEARGLQLQEQTLAAERAERAKTRFIAAASHDLRQPMHAIGLLAGMLKSRVASGQEQEVTQRLERSVAVMDNLFNAILDLSKLDSGAVRPAIAPVPLRAVLDSIVVHFAPEAASKQLALKVFPSRAIVRTDAALLERVLRNLVSNAIKYTSKGGVLVGCRRRGGRLAIGVWDTGTGIAPEDLERVFEEYFQVGGRPRDRSEGLGLGLSIVRQLARLLASEAKVVSTPGRGSWFGLEVPFVGYLPATGQGVAAEAGAASRLADKFILIVDDEADVRFGAEALLREWGCRTASAATVGEVRARLEEEIRFPDAVITDYRLGPRETGLEAIAAVHTYTSERTPAVIVTGEELGQDELDAARAAYPIVKKPLAADELYERLVAVLAPREERS